MLTQPHCRHVGDVNPQLGSDPIGQRLSVGLAPALASRLHQSALQPHPPREGTDQLVARGNLRRGYRALARKDVFSAVSAGVSVWRSDIDTPNGLASHAEMRRSEPMWLRNDCTNVAAAASLRGSV